MKTLLTKLPERTMLVFGHTAGTFSIRHSFISLILRGWKSCSKTLVFIASSLDSPRVYLLLIPEECRNGFFSEVVARTVGFIFGFKEKDRMMTNFIIV